MKESWSPEWIPSCCDSKNESKRSRVGASAISNFDLSSTLFLEEAIGVTNATELAAVRFKKETFLLPSEKNVDRSSDPNESSSSIGVPSERGTSMSPLQIASGKIVSVMSRSSALSSLNSLSSRGQFSSMTSLTRASEETAGEIVVASSSYPWKLSVALPSGRSQNSIL